MPTLSGPADSRNRALAALAFRMFRRQSIARAVALVRWCEPAELLALCAFERGAPVPRGPVLEALETRARTVVELDRTARGTLSESQRWALDSVIASAWTKPEVDEPMLSRERRIAQVSDALQMLLQLDESVAGQLVDHLAGVAKLFQPDVKTALREVAASEGLHRRELKQRALRHGFGLALAATLFRRHRMVVAPGDLRSARWRPSMTPRQLYQRVLSQGVRCASRWLLDEKQAIAPVELQGDPDELGELLASGRGEDALLDVDTAAAEQERLLHRLLERLTPGERAYVLHVLAEPGLTDHARDRTLSKKPGYSKVLRANVLDKLIAG